MRERIYIDTCALNRPTDDQGQARIRAESAAVAKVLDAAAEGAVDWIVSSFLIAELSRNPDRQRHQDTLRFLSMSSEFVRPTPATFLRAQQLRADGHGELDALHLAIAEETGVTSLLSVDDRFIGRAGRRPAGMLPVVANPVEWYRGKRLWLIKR
jgi:predicted nucleic acid-binding protein